MSKSKGNVIDPLDVISGITLKQLQDKLANSSLPEKEIKKVLSLPLYFALSHLFFRQWRCKLANTASSTGSRVAIRTLLSLAMESRNVVLMASDSACSRTRLRVRCMCFSFPQGF